MMMVYWSKCYRSDDDLFENIHISFLFFYLKFFFFLRT